MREDSKSVPPKNPEPILRKATGVDLDSVQALLLSANLPLEGVIEHFSHFFVLELNQLVIGSIGLELYVGTGLLRSVAVVEEWRSFGLGQRMVQAVLELATEQKWAGLFLLTETAQDYFKKFGFQKVERDQVPWEIKNSLEFQGACPISATAMRWTVDKVDHCSMQHPSLRGQEGPARRVRTHTIGFR